MKTYPVEIQQPGSQPKFYSAEYQTSQAARLQADLERAWNFDLQAHCLCQHDQKLPLYPRKAPRDFILCRYPDTGRDHAKDCAFYGITRTQSGAADYSSGVIRLEDGVLKIRPLHSLAKRNPGEAPAEMPVDRDTTTNRKQYGRASELGALHTFWEEFEINQWRPGMMNRRSWFSLSHHIIEKGRRVKYGQSELSASLAVIVPNCYGKAAEKFVSHAQSVLQSAHSKNRRFMLLGEMTRYKLVEGQPRCSIDGAWNNFHIDAYIPPELVQSWCRRYPLAIDAIEKDDRHCIGLLIGEVQNPDKKGRVGIKILHGALMAVTKAFIPYDSSHEALLADMLVQSERAFSKPLRYDSDDDSTLPDFLLLDVRHGDEYPCEVFGMATAEYLERRRAKEVYYNTTRGVGGWWHWDAVLDPNVPLLPDKRR